MKVQRLESNSYNLWERFLREDGFGTAFHSTNWLIQISKKLEVYVVLDKDDKLIGGIPLVKTKKNGLKGYHIPPYTHLFGPVIHQDYCNKSGEIIDILIKTLPKSGHYDFKMYLEEQDLIPWLANGYSVMANQTHIIPKEFDYGLSYLTKSGRRYVKKLLGELESGKIKIYENESQNKQLIRMLWIKTAERSDFKIHGKLLDTIFNSNVPNYTNIIVDNFEEPIAGTYCPYDSENMYHVIGASLRVEDSILKRANLLSLYTAITFANSRGLNFDTEGSNIPGVAKFYRMMGGQPKLIYRIQKSASLYYQILRAGNNIVKELKHK